MIMIITLWLLRRRPSPILACHRRQTVDAVYGLSVLTGKNWMWQKVQTWCTDVSLQLTSAVPFWVDNVTRNEVDKDHVTTHRRKMCRIFMAIDSSNLVVCCALTRYAKRSKDNGHDVFHIRHETLHNWGVNFRTVFKLRWNTVRLNKLKTAKRLKIKFARSAYADLANLIFNLLAFMNAEFVFVCLSIGFG